MPKHSKLWIVSALAVIVLGWVIHDQTGHEFDDQETQASQAVSAPQAPDVTFTLLNGKFIKLNALAGHKILLHFWASWCAPCRAEFADLLKLTQESGATLLAVSGDDNIQDVRAFLEPYQRDFKPLFDSGQVLVAIDPKHELTQGVFQTFQYPETIIIGPDFTMRRKIIGSINDRKHS